MKGSDRVLIENTVPVFSLRGLRKPKRNLRAIDADTGIRTRESQ
jgi:hypothetical protein